jgi:signal transduction histidine kinase
VIDVSNTAESETTQTPVPPVPDTLSERRAEELAEIIRAYNHVTARLQASHEILHAEVQRLQTDLASANAALQRSKRMAALGEMAAGIAHEIRNPLASIQLYAGMLIQDLRLHTEQCQIARKISSAVRGLDSVVNDVLNFSREIRVRTVEASVIEALKRAVESLRPIFEQNKIDVRRRGADLLLAYDPELLHQALVNLFRNAAEAMPDGGMLTLGLETDDQMVRLIIHDTGPGIPDEAIDRIFNPFFTTRPTGTGLGLAIVHRIVDAHGGSIAVHNDNGAVFTIALPRTS